MSSNLKFQMRTDLVRRVLRFDVFGIFTIHSSRCPKMCRIQFIKKYFSTNDSETKQMAASFVSLVENYWIISIATRI